MSSASRIYDPYIPTSPELIRAKLEFGEVCAQDTVFDLGCGDGRVLIMAAEEFGSQGVGVDVQLGVVEEAWSNVAERDLDDEISISQQDFLETDLGDADLVILYLTGRTLHALSDKLREVKPGTRIVTHDFPLAGWVHSEQSSWTSKSGEVKTLFLYRQN